MRKKLDDIFKKPKPVVGDFEFNQTVSAVFDDMLDRSVPFYSEIQRMVGELTGIFAQKGTRIYDLGCSTGNTILSVRQTIQNRKIKVIGVDSSLSMLDKCREKLRAAGLENSVDLKQADLNEGFKIENASVAILVLTLQFIRPLYREKLVKDIYAGLRQNGALIIVEKVLSKDSTLSRLFINTYYDFKKREGYSELEISQKREALENVLIPYTLDENLELLKKVGFEGFDVFFKWYNFCGLVARKGLSENSGVEK